MKTVSFPIKDLICCDDDKILSQKLKVHPHITDASVNLANNLATVTFHKDMISIKEIKKIISDCNFHCDRTPPLLSSKKALSIAEHKMAYQDKRQKPDSHQEMENSKIDH